MMETHPHDHCVREQERPSENSQLLVDIDSDSDIFFFELLKNFLRRTVHIHLNL